jgi:protein involved in polysaccharide export with SLBB domain
MLTKTTTSSVYRSLIGCLAVAFLAPFLQGQATDRQTSEHPTLQQTFTQRPHVPELSELARDNNSRVAASSVDIRTVLVKEPGLLVELKRWLANEATNNGQIVEDSDLTDQAVYEKLDRDIAFRSVATRMLQRYGYLIPTPNPDSDFAKEQDLILKERARRFVALEAQEDSEAMQPKKNPTEEEAASAACESGDDECESRQARRRSRRLPQNELRPPDTTFPPLPPPDMPSFSQDQRSLRSFSGGSDDLGGRDRSSVYPSAFSSPSGQSGSGTDIASGMSGLGAGMERGGPGSSLEDLLGGRSASPLSDLYGGANPSAKSSSVPFRPIPPLRYRPDHSAEEDVTPVKMVRPANPYADIPSLYDMYLQAADWQRPAKRFGIDVFRDTEDDFDIIPIDLPVGPDYVVGPGDSLSIDLWGGISQHLTRTVDRQGRVSLPESGPVPVSGKSLSDVQLSVQRILRNQYRDVSADVSVSRLRTVRVYVVGEVETPGAYDISSLSTPLNALIAAGGITGRGSLRQLKHFRGKELVQDVDAYDLLLHGVRSDVKPLQSGDTLLVPPVGPEVTVEGMVRRPAIYELRDENSLSQVLELAGGILPTAALRHIEVQRIEAHQKRTMLSLTLTTIDGDEDITRQLAAFKIRAGDQIHIFPIAGYNEDAIYLQGHVLRPGKYSYKEGMKLTDIISSYADLLPEPAPHYGEIIRINPPDFHPSVESFDLKAALADPASAPVLQPLDTIRVYSRFAFEPPPKVAVGGEVRQPGEYKTAGQAHLRDAIYLAGGATPDASMDSAQLFRSSPDGSLKVLSVNLGGALAGNPADNILLQARDRILIHRNAAQVEPATVYVKGEVAKPGRYPLASEMRVQDLVRVAGGLKPSADGETADLTRFAAGNSPTDTNQRFDVKLVAALNGDESQDLALRNGDVLTIRQVPQWGDLGSYVTVRGEVQHPATYGIEPGERLSSLLQRCGGFTPQAAPYGAVLVRREVREIQMKSHAELIDRVKEEQRYLKTLPEGDPDQRDAKLTAVAQTQTVLQQLETTTPIGRVVVHIPSDAKSFESFANSAADVPLRSGDELIIPKKNNYVMVSGQVFNPTAVSYIPGRSAKWYLSQAGGLTQMGDKKAAFVIRADGSVLSAKNNSGFWSGDPMNAVLKPGDSIVVPERAAKVGTTNWLPLLQAAQVAASVALTVAYIHP